MPEPPLLQVRCHTALGSLRLAAEFDVSAPYTTIFGASGSGKSSLLRLIAGLWSPPGTSVVLRGDDLSRTPAHRRRIALVEQRPALFPHRDVLGNICFACRDAAVGEAMLELFDLHAMRHAPVRQLSGGEYQRVALARALASRPRLLLLDEVFTGMHAQQRDLLLTRLREHCTSMRLPVIAVTHDVVEASAEDGEVIRLAEGKVAAQGVAADVLAPEREALRQALRG